VADSSIYQVVIPVPLGLLDYRLVYSIHS
jgi:hypothetical protein